MAEARESQGIEEFAASIWHYVKSSDNLVEELDGEVCFVLSQLGSTCRPCELRRAKLSAHTVARMKSNFCGCEQRSKRSSSYPIPSTFSQWFTIRLRHERTGRFS